MKPGDYVGLFGAVGSVVSLLFVWRGSQREVKRDDMTNLTRRVTDLEVSLRECELRGKELLAENIELMRKLAGAR